MGAAPQGGLNGLLASVVKGKGAMPARAGTSLTDEELSKAIVFMANQAGGNLKEPAPPRSKSLVPHLTTALNGPLLELEQRILDANPAIERWFPAALAGTHAADLLLGGPAQFRLQTRAGGHQPVSRRLQQSRPAFLPLAVQAATAAIEKICPDAKNLLLVPENHTRNKWYLENVFTLAAILRQTGLEVRIGSLNPEITATTELETASGKKLRVEPLVR